MQLNRRIQFSTWARIRKLKQIDFYPIITVAANDQAELQADRDIFSLKSRNRLAVALFNMVKRGFEHRLNLRLNLLLDFGRVLP